MRLGETVCVTCSTGITPLTAPLDQFQVLRSGEQKIITPETVTLNTKGRQFTECKTHVEYTIHKTKTKFNLQILSIEVNIINEKVFHFLFVL